MGALNYSMRPSLATDFPLLFSIHRAALGDYVEATWGPWDDEFQRDHFRAMLVRGLVRVVEVSGEVVGLLELDDGLDRVGVVNIELTPTLHGQGLGTRILNEIIATAGRRPVVLQVLKVNPARRLYDRLGFVQTGEIATHYLMRRDPTPQG